jgi:alkyl hydroperoxide reductase subunit F
VDKARASKTLQPVRGFEPVEIKGDEVVRELVLRNVKSGKARTLKVDGVFIEVGLFPNSDFMLDLVDTNRSGEIVVDGGGLTGARGVFAAGDVTDNHDKQVVVAAGEGAKAALAAFDYLIRQK